MTSVVSNGADARARLRDDVITVVAEQGPGLELRGSFYYGDFHFSSRHRTTLSDVDLVWPGSTPDVSRAASIKLHEALRVRTGLSIRTSVQPERNFEHLAVVDARFLAVGEYLRWAPRLMDNDLALGH